MESLVTASPVSEDNNGGGARRQRRPGDIVRLNTEKLPAHQRDALRRLHAHGDRHDMTNKALGAMIGYSESTMSRIFGYTLSYEGNLDEVCVAIDRALGEVRAAEKAVFDATGRVGFVRTGLSDHIFKLGHAAVEYQRMVFMYGDSQIGKSRNTKELVKSFGGNGTYWEMPVGGALSNFLANGADACGFGARAKTRELRRRLINCFDGKSLLVIDQMHRAFSDDGENSEGQRKTLDFIIEIFDAKAPGILLSGTNVFRDGTMKKTYEGFFNQLRRRGLNTDGFQLPSVPSQKDLDLFARAYGLPPATGSAVDLQNSMVKDHGLGVWITRLTSARKACINRARPINWDEVQRAHDFFTKMGQPIDKEAK